MTEKRMAQTDLDRLLAHLRERGTVYAPVQDEAGDAVLAALAGGETVTLDYRNFRLSPKALVLPQNQTLLCFKDGQAEEPRLPEGETFLFGVRPCDARAMLALDRVFLDGDPHDPYYARLRDRMTVISLACDRPMSTCFCTSVGGSPGDGAGADVLAAALGEELLLKAETPKGEKLLASVTDLLGDATQEAINKAQEQVRAAEDQIAPVKVDGSAQRLRDAYDSPLWEAASRKCLGCGTCSFLCPTCHCFDITDEMRGGRGRRVRTWDCCAYPLFTLHASGHNPRPMPKERWRQRIMHKFRYAVENFDRLFCVGCGRCIRHCPASLDLRTVLKEVGA
jgi:ferredoxin